VHATVTCRYDELSSVVTPGAETFVLIAAHQPSRDLAAVEAVTGLDLGYLGVLGSRSKVAHLALGSSVHAPMGLPIGSHTPDEIAISVAAELIAVVDGENPGGSPTPPYGVVPR
ncbi:MAG TPA: XdhC family protein, partial [Propionibacteriaceae bacterium]|nr:XdhC family protein [Propionibacteriaceae bacterium]